MVLRCHGDSKDEPVNCKEICDSVHGEVCCKECDSLLTETPDILAKCHKKCSRDLGQCIDDCLPFYLGWE